MQINSGLTEESFPFSAVLWDMDGTLIDSEPIWISQERELMNSLGVDWSHEDAIHCIGGPMTRVDAYMRKKLSPQLRELYPEMALTKLLLSRMELELAKGVAFAPGAEQLFNQFTQLGLPQALVSASSRPLVDAALDFIGRERFQVTISNDEVVESKPSPEGYLSAATQLGVDIENCLVLEDSVTGVTAGINSGAFVLAIPHVSNLPIAPKVVHKTTLESLNLADLVKLFEKVRG